MVVVCASEELLFARVHWSQDVSVEHVGIGSGGVGVDDDDAVDIAGVEFGNDDTVALLCVDIGTGSGVGYGVGFGVGYGVGFGVGDGVGVGVGFGVGGGAQTGQRNSEVQQPDRQFVKQFVSSYVVPRESL